MEKLRQLFEKHFGLQGLPIDERRRQFFVSLCIFAAVPVSAVYALHDFFQGRVFEGVFLLSMDALLLLVLALFRYLKKFIVMFRICAVIGMLVMVYELAIGGGEGHSFLWFYFYPITFFYIFGRIEGLYWSLVSVAALALLMFTGASRYSYGVELGVRILLTYSIVTVLSYAFESSREYYYRALLDEKQLLEKALGEVTALSGLLPLCSHCKKVRDDKGYWNQIEAYISEHSDAGFSHGICPECAEKYYPEMDLYGSTGSEQEGPKEQD